MDLPIGSIVMFDGSTPPIGWYDCDGGTYFGVSTPNLIGAFPRGTPAGGTLGATGGSATHLHNNSKTDSVTHGHAAVQANSGANNNRTPGIWAGSTYTAVDDHQHLLSVSALTGQTPHDHTVPNTNAGSSMPPYMRLRYIMRCE